MATTDNAQAGTATKPAVEGRGLGGPGAEHQGLARFAGRWRAQVKIWFDPAAPPNESSGTMTSTMVLGGRFLQQEYSDDAAMFSGKGFWGYSDADRRYEGFWIDVMANMFHIEHGHHDPVQDIYTMQGSLTQPTNGRPMRKRSVIAVHGPDSHSIEMFFQPEGAPERKAMEIQYRRA